MSGKRLVDERTRAKDAVKSRPAPYSGTSIDDGRDIHALRPTKYVNESGAVS